MGNAIMLTTEKRFEQDIESFLLSPQGGCKEIRTFFGLRQKDCFRLFSFGKTTCTDAACHYLLIDKTDRKQGKK